MLNKKFKHNTWFKNSDMTVKQFLDYVLAHNGDFIIKQKKKFDSDELFSDCKTEYHLTDRRCSIKLDYQERNYLALNSEYFKSKLPQANENYLMAIIAASGEPIADNHDIVYLSR